MSALQQQRTIIQKDVVAASSSYSHSQQPKNLTTRYTHH
nr:MAG TPA: hypothetical protein [Caudoviricetes sp.]